MQARTGHAAAATNQAIQCASVSHAPFASRFMVQLDMRKRIKGNMAKDEMGEGPEPEATDAP